MVARNQVFLWLPIYFGTGIGVYFSLMSEPPRALHSWLIAAGLILTLLARFEARVLPFAWAACFAALGFGIAGLQSHRAAAPVLEYRYYGPIEGRVVAIDRSSSGALRVTLDQVRLDRMAPVKRPERVRVSLHGEQPFVDPKPGQVLMMTGHLSPPSGPVEPGGFDFQRHAWFQQLGGVGYTRVPVLLQSPAERNGFALWIFGVRMELSAAIKNRMAAREGAFASAILTGDRSDLDTEALEALRASNLAHLLAISGMHMGMLTGVVFVMIRLGFAFFPSVAMRCNPKKIAAIAAFVAALCYLGISGASVATQRAFIMVSVMLFAVCLDRRALTLRAVAIAALIVLAIRPDSLAGPGFQMSFAATTALVAVFAEVRDRNLMLGWPRWWRNFVSLVISSGIAGIATAPFGALHFNQMAQWGLIANLASVPVMGTLVMPGAVLAAVLSPFGFENLGLQIMQLGVRWIIFVAETVAGWDSALRLFPSPGPWVLPLRGLGGALICLLQSHWRLSGCVVLAGAFGLWMSYDRPTVLISDTGTLIGVMTPEGRALNKPRGEGFVAGAWLENDGDPATQKSSWERGGFERNTVSTKVGQSELLFVNDKDLGRREASRLCAKADILILPQLRSDLTCDVINRNSLRGSGSIAIFETENGPKIVTTRDLRGARLWAR
ncbi:MAG: ComEC/Rec2 family competence protein [Litoreibacter sp.]|nr:ComEC/Rec2 family competence protein [Litoreibacter sp.]